MDDLFNSYIDVCNEALQKNAGRFPFEQMIMAAQDENGSAPACRCIVGGEKDNSYRLTLENRKISYKPINGDNNTGPDNARNWHVSLSYLEDVISHPEHYIENPARLNWDWLY